MSARLNSGGEDTPIRVKALRTAFGEKVIHENLDLEVRRGEILGVVGGSGSGKSVLLNTILGLKHPDGGSVELFGRDIRDPPTDRSDVPTGGLVLLSQRPGER